MPHELIQPGPDNQQRADLSPMRNPIFDLAESLGIPTAERLLPNARVIGVTIDASNGHVGVSHPFDSSIRTVDGPQIIAFPANLPEDTQSRIFAHATTFGQAFSPAEMQTLEFLVDEDNTPSLMGARPALAAEQAVIHTGAESMYAMAFVLYADKPGHVGKPEPVGLKSTAQFHAQEGKDVQAGAPVGHLVVTGENRTAVIMDGRDALRTITTKIYNGPSSNLGRLQAGAEDGDIREGTMSAEKAVAFFVDKQNARISLETRETSQRAIQVFPATGEKTEKDSGWKRGGRSWNDRHTGAWAQSGRANRTNPKDALLPFALRNRL